MKLFCKYTYIYKYIYRYKAEEINVFISTDKTQAEERVVNIFCLVNKRQTWGHRGNTKTKIILDGKKGFKNSNFEVIYVHRCPESLPGESEPKKNWVFKLEKKTFIMAYINAFLRGFCIRWTKEWS